MVNFVPLQLNTIIGCIDPKKTEITGQPWLSNKIDTGAQEAFSGAC